MLDHTTSSTRANQFVVNAIRVAQNAPATVSMKAFAPNVPDIDEANSAKMTAAKINMLTRQPRLASFAMTSVKSVEVPGPTTAWTAET